MLRLPRTFPRATVVVAVAVAAVVLLAGTARAATLVALWNMGDSGTTMSDATGRGHTGTLHHVAVQQPGLSGKAFGFSGSPSYVSVPASSDFTPGTGNFGFKLSVRFSTRPSSAVGDYDLLRMGLATTSGGDYKLEILQNGKAFCLFRGASGTGQVSGGPALSTNTWHTLSCSRIGTSVVLTVDGATYQVSANTGAITSSKTLFIGAKDGTGADQYAGLMDSVSVTKG